MKNKIYYLGIAACLLTACGCMFKIQHWAGAGIILVIGLIMLALVFLPLATGSIVKSEASNKLKTFYILVAVVMAVNFISALFKIMHWPGAGALMMVSIPLPFVVLLPAYLLTSPDDKEINYINFLAIMFFFAYFAAITAFLSIQISTSVIDGFTRSAGVIEEKTTVLAENTRLMSFGFEKEPASGISATAKNQLTFAANELCNRIEEIKKTIIENGSNNMDRSPVIKTGSITELKTDINNFKSLLQKSCSHSEALNNYLDQAFEMNYGNSGPESWEDSFMKDKILASAIFYLDLLEFRVRLVTNEVLAR